MGDGVPVDRFQLDWCGDGADDGLPWDDGGGATTFCRQTTLQGYFTQAGLILSSHKFSHLSLCSCAVW